ncbi:hypothetical protein Prudu_002203 [Prunus dulcis]|uniref:hAT-like transposase RNase-H fold domain-containing protein n=1 Tax=Prunus dulcis TaxID=3755 RepID=A0A4Y1QQ85_PRUDU|nr:hypothetical protein Prudu_002203 [Prunus dulcis]
MLVFYDATLKMSVTLHPASHTTFHDLIAMEEEIEDLLMEEEEILSETQTSKVLKDMSLNMKIKFKKYWGDLDKFNQILMVALVLDPRYKLGNLEFILKSRFENPEDAVKKKNEIKEILKKLYEEYVMPPPPPPPPTQSSSYCSSDTTTMNTSSSLSRGGKKRRQMTENWRKETRANDVVVLEHKIDMYITDPIEEVVDESDVLKSDDISSLQYEPTIQEMEFYESIKLDIMSSSTPSTIAPATFQYGFILMC